MVSFTCAGTKRIAITSAISASGRVITKTEPQSNSVSSAPAASGPSDEIAAPSADQSAIEWVRAGPDQSAVINARVVGKAIPAETPPTSRATNRTSTEGANAATRQAGIESPTPRISSRLRPWRSPTAPR